MTPEKQAAWRALLAPVDPETAAHDEAWEDGAPKWMFHAFASTGAGVEPFFPESAAGRAAALRLRETFACADATPGFGYLIPRARPFGVELGEAAIAHTAMYLASMRALMPRAIADRELEADDPGLPLLSPDTIEVVDERRVLQEDDPGQAALYVLAAWYGRCCGAPDADDLREPLYGLACRYELANWIAAPLLDPRGRDHDPFAGWTWLWRHGRELVLEEGRALVAPR